MSGDFEEDGTGRVEMTLIVVALLAAAGGLVVAAASVLRWGAAHRKDLLGAAERASRRLHMQRVAGLAVRLRPPWLFGMSAGLGLAVITAAAVGAGALMEDVTDGDGVAVLDHPVTSFVAAAAFGVLAFLCAGPLRAWTARVAIWAGAAMLTTLVGISRVYLGVHWATDVLGGWAFGAMWLAVVVTGSAVLARGPGGRRGP